MKRIFMAVALLASLTVSAQQKGAVKTKDQCVAAITKAEAAANDAKKAKKVATWMTLAQACMDAYSSPQGAGWLGAGEADIKLVMSNVKPVGKKEVVNVGGNNMTKVSYPTCNYYYNEGGVLSIIEVTKPFVEDALDKALNAYQQAYAVDLKKSKLSDIKAGIQKVSEYYVEEAYTEYGFGRQAAAAGKFERAYEVSLVEPYASVDTNSLYNAALMCYMNADFDHAAELFGKCLDFNYFGKDGDVFAKLSDIAGKKGDKAASMEYLEQGFVKYPQSQTILIGLINAYLSSNENTGRLFDLLDVAKKNEPNNASLYYVEGNIHAQLGETEKAVESYRQCSSVDPKYAYGYIGEALIYYKKAGEISDAAQNEMDDAKYMALVKDFEEQMRKCIEPFEKAFETTEDVELKKSLADYLKSIYYRFVDEGDQYKAGYDKYDKFVKEGN